ncbi:MAG: tetratricopeptide repeat protein [Caldilineaceae bacterium]
MAMNLPPMVSTPTTAPPASTYATPHSASFGRYIEAGLQEMLTRVAATENLVDEEDRQQAWHLLSFALDVEVSWPATRALLLALAPKMEQAGFRADWLLYLEQGVQASRQQCDRLAEAELALQIGIVQRLMSNFERAHRWLTVSLEQSAALNQLRNQARVLNELAWLDYLQQHYQAAVEHVEQAMTKLDHEDAERGMSYRVLGMIAINQERWQEAEIYHRQALAAFEAQGDVRKIARGLANLAGALLGQERLQEAIVYYQQVAALFEEVGDSYHLAIVQMNLGRTYYQDHQLHQAILYYHQAEVLLRKLHDRLNLAHTYTNLGNCNRTLLSLTVAEENFVAAMALYEELGESGWHLNAMDGLVMTLLADQRFDQALEWLERALAILPTVQHTSNYAYLCRSLNEHLAEAKRGQEHRSRHS